MEMTSNAPQKGPQTHSVQCDRLCSNLECADLLPELALRRSQREIGQQQLHETSELSLVALDVTRHGHVPVDETAAYSYSGMQTDAPLKLKTHRSCQWLKNLCMLRPCAIQAAKTDAPPSPLPHVRHPATQGL